MPIARREMLVLARSPSLYRARLATGLMTLVGGVAFAVVYSHTGIQSVFPFLGMVGYMLSMMCLFSGAQLSADTVSKEKREGTLGLVYLTGLPSWQIAFGKLIASGISAFFGMFVTFPLLSLLLITGGAQPMEIFRMALALLNTLFTSSAMGLFVSTWSFEQKRAAGRATILVLFFWWGLPLLSRFNATLGGPPWVTTGLLLLSLNSSFTPTIIGARMGLGTSATPWFNLLALHLLGWAFLGASCWMIPRQWQDKPQRERFSLKRWWHRISFGGAEKRGQLRAKLLAPNPFVWLAVRDRLRFLGVWILTGMMLGIAWFIYYANSSQAAPLVVFCIAITFVHRFVAVSVGASQVLAEQEQGTLEMLLSTPLSAREILDGQFRAAVRQLRGPIALVLALHGATWLAFHSTPGMPEWVFGLLLGGSCALYLFDVYTAIWLAMWGAATANNARRASGVAIARLFGIPFFVTTTAIMFLSLSSVYFGWRWRVTPQFVLPGIFLLIVGNNFYWLARVRRDLAGRLRVSAFRRYAPEEELGFLGSVGRSIGRAYAARRMKQI